MGGGELDFMNTNRDEATDDDERAFSMYLSDKTSMSGLMNALYRSSGAYHAPT